MSDFERKWLPLATAAEVGAVQIGSGLAVEEGVVSVPGYPLASALVSDDHGSPMVASVTSGGTVKAFAIAGSALPVRTRCLVYGDVLALTDGASIATNCGISNRFSVTLAGNRTLANPTNMQAGTEYMWVITQDATGSRTLAYGTAFSWGEAGAPVLSTGANKIDIIVAYCTGTKLCASIAKGF